MISRLLYNVLAVPAMETGLLCAALFSGKVRQGLAGRVGEAGRFALARSRCRDEVSRILIHCSSAGELESAIPLMKSLKDTADVDILLSIYSPSAVQRAKQVHGASARFYLPFDSAYRMLRMLEILDPALVVMVKHDVWPNLVWQARNRGIPTALVNGNFRPDSSRLYPFARWFNRRVFGALNAIYTVGEDDAARFRSLAGLDTVVKTVGDTRFDRVRQRALAGKNDQGELAAILVGRPVAVAGSTWPEDEKLLLPAWSRIIDDHPDAVLVLVPHEPTPEHLRWIDRHCGRLGLENLLLSEMDNGVKGDAAVLVVNRTGVLAGMYGLGRIAYVGGGFGKGVHSVIEPAVFGIPVLFGPHYLNSHEARDLAALGAAVVVESGETVFTEFSGALNSREESLRRGEPAREFVGERTGVSSVVARELVGLAGL